MKNLRLEKIVEIITQNPVETQEQLATLLRDAGYQVTQATVSRDIKQLKLIKVTDTESGRQRYALHTEGQKNLDGTYIRVFKDGVLSMDLAMNILVVKPVSGMAMAVAAAMDAMKLNEIVGTIAGDDTIMCAIRTVEDAKAVLWELQKVLQQ